MKIPVSVFRVSAAIESTNVLLTESGPELPSHGQRATNDRWGVFGSAKQRIISMSDSGDQPTLRTALAR